MIVYVRLSGQQCCVRMSLLFRNKRHPSHGRCRVEHTHALDWLQTLRLYIILNLINVQGHHLAVRV